VAVLLLAPAVLVELSGQAGGRDADVDGVGRLLAGWERRRRGTGFGALAPASSSPVAGAHRSCFPAAHWPPSSF